MYKLEFLSDDVSRTIRIYDTKCQFKNNISLLPEVFLKMI